MEGNFMLKEYFKIIRKALLENRIKGNGIYYEAHHIIPRSFNKKSTKVLLTAEEHYDCHKLLAQIFNKHFLYGKKMLWALHKMTYSKRNHSPQTREEFAQSREILMNLWTRKKTEEHKKNMNKKRKGTKTIFNPKTKELNYVRPEEMEYYLNNGWENTNLVKGMKRSDETKQLLGDIVRKRLTGRVGINSQASKGIVIYENLITGEKIEEGSILQLSKKVGIPQPTLSVRLNNKSALKGYKVYYK